MQVSSSIMPTATETKPQPTDGDLYHTFLSATLQLSTSLSADLYFILLSICNNSITLTITNTEQKSNDNGKSKKHNGKRVTANQKNTTAKE